MPVPVFILRCFIIGGCFLLLGCETSDTDTSISQPQAKQTATLQQVLKVLVIGAGVAGLSAGFELQQAGHEVIILEARDRVGGRIWSDRRDREQSVDLGAAWIHGIKGNPLYKLAQAQNVKVTATDYDNLIIKNAPKGQPLTSRELVKLMALLTDILEHDSFDNVNTSINQLVDKFSDANPGIDAQKLDYVVNLLIEQEFAAPIEWLSVYALQEGVDVFPGYDVMFPGGYQQIFRHMVAVMDIRLQQVVNKINYQGNEVQVATTNNAFYTADKVIITVPLGVLKKGKIGFEPQLPAAKRKAIESLGMGLFNKVYLAFPEVFWERDVDFIAYYSQQKTLWPSILNLYKQYGDKALVAISTAQEAVEIEAKSDAEIVMELMAILQEQYGTTIPQPNDVRITRWAQDPFAFGSYSFMKIGADSQSRKDLAATVADKLYFAGEATSTDYPATVHGALFSGLREARKVIASVKND